MSFSRRRFIKKVGVVSIVAPFLQTSCLQKQIPSSKPLSIHLFSKHLQFLDLKSAAQVVAELGFDGLDLTVRPKGHVLPENVKLDLPKAMFDIKKGGSKCEMITTAVSDVSNPLDNDVIKTASKEGIKYYRSDWFKFKEDISLEESLDYYKVKVQELGEINQQHNIIGCYQNHSGTKVGASIWEVKKILEMVNTDYFGAQYDIRHAVAEGGRSWSNGLKLIKNHIKTIVLKDFKWGQVNGKWKIVNVPVGEGMVDFDAYFKLLKNMGLNPPVTLHLEYPLGGAEKGRSEISVNQKIVFDAMQKDLLTIQRLWKNA